MLKELREFLQRLRQRARNRADERREQKARARFWQQLREGEREAEAMSGN